MAGEFEEFFNQFLWGSGSLLGLIVICVLILLLAGFHKYGGIIGMTIGLLVGITLYLPHELGWHALISFIVSILAISRFIVTEVKK